ncbi:MAG: glycosyltransferase family 4 protein [Methanospirillaceae archaeon]|nr:glycosyltransferase family 4 protein [Methanospirillaceae archaeon]
MKIAYIFTEGRKSRLREIELGISKPHEFLFGLTELRANGHDVDIYELSDFSPDIISARERILLHINQFISYHTGLSSCSHLLAPEKLQILNNYDVLIAGNEYIAFGLHYYRKRQVISTPMLFFVMGMLSRVKLLKEECTRSIRLFLAGYYAKNRYKNLLDSSVMAIFLGQGEIDIARNLYPEYENRYAYLPFAVDTRFWRPSETGDEQSDTILFLGNDQQRNYQLLVDIAALTPDISYLFLTQRLNPSQVPQNVRLIRSDWKKEYLSDEAIRHYIQRSIALILPLHETYQPSGQSVCQQSMACGKCVLISHTKGFWSPALIHDNEHVLFMNNANPVYWACKINEIIRDKSLREKIGKNARILMENQFSVEHQGIELNGLLLKSIPPSIYTKEKNKRYKTKHSNLPK